MTLPYVSYWSNFTTRLLAATSPHLLLLSQDAFVSANSSIVVCFLRRSLSRMKLHRLSDRTPLPPLRFPTLPFSCKWECCFSVVIPNDKEVCNLNAWRQPPHTHPNIYLQSALLMLEGSMIGGSVRRGWTKWAVLAAFQVPSRVGFFDAVLYKVISWGCKKTLLLLNVPKRMFCFHVAEKWVLIECVK